MSHRLAAPLVATALLMAVSGAAAKAPASWDGMVRVPSKQLDLVYLQPGADFRAYTKVMIDPTEVAFAKNWQRDYNNSTRSTSSRISDREMQRTISEGVSAATDIFTEAWTKGGYAIVTAPGPDVMRVRTGVVNIEVSAPDVMTAGRSRTFSRESGQATLFVEARDSMTGALLGRAVDQRIVGDHFGYWRSSSISNRGDFREQVKRWADVSVRGMSELKALSPIRP